MKKFLLLILSGSMLLACAKESEIQDLQKQINELKSDQIASINSQISGITLSLGNIQSVDDELRGYIQTLQQQREALVKADEDLRQSILDLKTEIYGAISTEKTNILSQLETEKRDILDEISGIRMALLELQAREQGSDEKDADLQRQITELDKTLSSLQIQYSELTDQIMEIERELNSQITAAQVDMLSKLEAYKESMSSQLDGINTSLVALQEKDAELQHQIGELKNYVEKDLKTYIDNGENEIRNWVSATFVTMEQFNTTAEIIAGIQEKLLAVNQQMAQWDDRLAQMGQNLEQSMTALDTSVQETIRNSMSECTQAIETAKQEITNAYTKAISDAISASESTMKTWVNNQLTGYYTISQTDAKLASLQSDFEGRLNSQKAYLQGLISSLETSLTHKINDNKTLIEGLQTQIDGLDDDLAGLAATVATHSADISSNSAEIANNARKIATNASNIATNALDIDACEQLIAANKLLIEQNSSAIRENASAIVELQNRAADNAQNSATNTAAIAVNAANITKNAEDIAANAALISANATAISNNARAISENAADIVQIRADLESVKTELTDGYQRAVSTAISTLDGQLRGQIAAEVETLNGRVDREVTAIKASIEALTNRVARCEEEIVNINNAIESIQQELAEIQDQISKILPQIQSITYVPAYTDGTAVVVCSDDGELTPEYLTLDFKIQPASMAADLVQVWQTALTVEAVYTLTKAAPETIQLLIENVSAENGYLTVKANGAGLKEDFLKGNCGAYVTLIISDGNNERNTEYIPIRPLIDYVEFDDAAFKAYCVGQFDVNGDGELYKYEVRGVASIDAKQRNIASIKGVEHFTDLEYLDVSKNNLSSIDLSHCPKLKSINVSNNQLTAANFADMSELETVIAYGNALSLIDISKDTKIKALYVEDKNTNAISGNSISFDGYAQSTSLKLVFTDLSFDTLNITNSTSLTSLDITENVQLKSLSISGCSKIAVMDVSMYTDLTALDVSSSGLTALDVTNNSILETLYVNRSPLASLKITEAMDCLIGQSVCPEGKWAVIYSASEVVKVVSAKEGYNLSWGYAGTLVGATSKSDGASNTDMIASGSAAAKWCRELGPSWYLPAFEELKEVFNKLTVINSTLSEKLDQGPVYHPSGDYYTIGFPIGSGYHWTSTENASYPTAAYMLASDGRYVNVDPKTRTLTVRAIRAI